MCWNISYYNMENILISELISGNTFDQRKIIEYSAKYNKKNVLNYIPATKENNCLFQQLNIGRTFNLQSPDFSTLAEYSEYIINWYNTDIEILTEVREGNLKNLTSDIYSRWFRYILPDYICCSISRDIILSWIDEHHPDDLYKTIIDSYLVANKKEYLDHYNFEYDDKFLENLMDSLYQVDFCMSKCPVFDNYINLELKNNFYILEYKKKVLQLNSFLESTIRFHFFVYKLGYFRKEITIENFDELIDIYYNEYSKYDSPAYYIYNNYREEDFRYDRKNINIITDEYKIFYYNYRLEKLIDISEYNNIVNYCKKYEMPDLDDLYNLYHEELFNFIQHLIEIRDIKNNPESKYIELIYKNISKYVKTDFVKYLLDTI